MVASEHIDILKDFQMGFASSSINPYERAKNFSEAVIRFAGMESVFGIYPYRKETSNGFIEYYKPDSAKQRFIYGGSFRYDYIITPDSTWLIDKN